MRFLSFQPIIPTLLLALLGSPVGAQTTPSQTHPEAGGPPKVSMLPGRWLVTAKPEMQGSAMMAIPKTADLCLTPADVAAGQVAVFSIPGCTVEGGDWAGGRLQLRLACIGLPPQATVSGFLQVSAKVLSGEVTVVLYPDKQEGERGHITYTQQGQWVSEACLPSR